MNIKLLITPVLLSSALLVACSNEYSAQKSKEINAEIAKDIETDMNKAISETKADMKEINVDLINGGKAIIAANGDMTIAGKAIVLNDSQRALSKKYFDTSKKMALQGIEIGKESAKLATQAIGAAITSVFKDTEGADGKDFEKNIEAKAGNIEAVAQKLCSSAMELKVIQEKLAAAVPAFTPEPMEVITKEDGCEVNSGADDHISINSDEPTPPPPTPPEPPKVPDAPAAPTK